ncbi:MAG: ribosome assembly RNA-binding protein YhbY [Gammaproteobacteria bacterium]
MPATEKPLSERQKKHLRGLAHALRPLVRLGSAGITEAFLAELEATLAHHELIKVKVAAATRAERNAAIETLKKGTGASLIAQIGNVAVLYRANPTTPRLVLPDA